MKVRFSSDFVVFISDDIWKAWMANSARGVKPGGKFSAPSHAAEFTPDQQPLTDGKYRTCALKNIKLKLSKIMSPFPTFDYKWDPDTVITLGDANSATIKVSILKILCHARVRRQANAKSAQGRAWSHKSGC